MLLLDDATADGHAVVARTSRVGGALSTSIAAHALLILAFWGLTRMVPAVQPPKAVSPFDPTSIVFRAIDGPGASGDDGGNRSTTPAAAAQTHPRDAVAVVVSPPPPLQPPPTIMQELTLTPDAPVLPLLRVDAGAIPQVGPVVGPSAPPSDSRGPGDRDVGTGKDGDGPGLTPGDRHGPGNGTRGNGDGVRPPQILYKTQPQYTTDAMRAKLQGTAVLSGIVEPDGTLHDIRVARSLDPTFGLDQEAIKCVQQWRFRPGTRTGTPVAVAVTIEVAFNLR